MAFQAKGPGSSERRRSLRTSSLDSARTGDSNYEASFRCLATNLAKFQALQSNNDWIDIEQSSNLVSNLPGFTDADLNKSFGALPTYKYDFSKVVVRPPSAKRRGGADTPVASLPALTRDGKLFQEIDPFRFKRLRGPNCTAPLPAGLRSNEHPHTRHPSVVSDADLNKSCGALSTFKYDSAEEVVRPPSAKRRTPVASLPALTRDGMLFQKIYPFRFEELERPHTHRPSRSFSATESSFVREPTVEALGEEVPKLGILERLAKSLFHSAPENLEAPRSPSKVVCALNAASFTGSWSQEHGDNPWA
ncbi:hypothetical protein T484DRAFT_1762436 [Baffinella frigidus]|nr:hypothetical protein T484DRAFT_1762436 [Cryptophyta sp. CCMP2293]